MISAMDWIPFFYSINFYPMPAPRLPKNLSIDELVKAKNELMHKWFGNMI
jgi:hypothetical protein